ncbi:MAG TPA: histidine kinase [Solirubrobacteraceae bacterium]|jgi:two-component system sensor histidine kinase DesK
MRSFLASDRWMLGRGASRTRGALSLVWLAFILVPLVTAITNQGRGHGYVIAAAAVFTATYVGLVMVLFHDERHALRLVLFGLLLAVTIALTVADRPGWAFLFTYCSACAAMAAPLGFGFPAVLGCTVLAVVCSLLGGASNGAAIGYGASAIGIGLLMVLMRDLRTRNKELTEARAALAATAVIRERERFARDLHDLLGHTLSVIALKAELAGRLLPDSPQEAAGEVAEVEQVARQALGEVRQAVSGYRRPTLEGELAGARMALSAAGIEADVQRPPIAFDPDVEAVLAWAVREGATNVIRHSGARHCCVRVSARLGDAAVEVLDDGSAGAPVAGGGGTTDLNGNGGHGLAGLRERAEALRGRIEAGGRPEGGFRLAVSVPVLGDR